MIPLKACSDAELWSAICQDDKKAFDALFERYWTLLYNTAYAYLKDDDAASQIVHDIFLNLWQKRQVYEIQSFRSYLSTAARYHVYKVLKARKQKTSYTWKTMHSLIIVDIAKTLVMKI